MKRKLLSLLVLLMTAISCAWAQGEYQQGEYLYLDDFSGTTAKLYCRPSIPNSGIPYYHGAENVWRDNGYEDFDNFTSSCTEITVGESCQGYNGNILSQLFDGFRALEGINELGNLNTSKVEDMSSMFGNCSALTTLDLSGWSTSKVTQMQYMFYECSGLTSLNVSGWNTSSVKDMTAIFYGCSKLELPDVSGWDTSSVTNMMDMFANCSSLTTLDLSGWSTSKVTQMQYMFYGCTNLKTLDITGWDTSNVTNSTDMFTGCTKLSYDVTAKAGETGAYWATFYGVGTGYNFQAPSGTRVFAVDLDTSKDEISMIEITDGIIKSSEGVVLKSTSNSITLTPTITASTGNYTNNSLMGTLTEITPGENDYYVLNKKGAGIGFYKLSNTGTIGANKAYLSYNNPEGDSSNAREFIGFEEATGLKAIDNGQLTIDNVVYDLQGRRVQNPTKGLYIVNGKKVVIK